MNHRDLPRRLGLGKLALYLWHQPSDFLGDLWREGGPWQRRQTERGRREMEQAAAHLPKLAAVDETAPPRPLHLLTGKRFWYQTAFCLWTFARQSSCRIAPTLYDDGTLGPDLRDHLARLFPLARFVSQTQTRQRLDEHLPAARFPALRERWLNYPNIRKLTDIHAGQSGWKLVIDSDLLFFRRPDLLTSWLDRPDQPLHAVDVTTSYGYTRPLLESLAAKPLADLVNVGLCGLNSAEIDWDKIEHWCRTLIDREGTSYYLEQALVALLVAGRACTIPPARDYVTLPRPPEAHDCRAIMHHYVAESKRWYFQTNWRRCLET